MGVCDQRKFNTEYETEEIYFHFNVTNCFSVYIWTCVCLIENSFQAAYGWDRYRMKYSVRTALSHDPPVMIRMRSVGNLQIHDNTPELQYSSWQFACSCLWCAVHHRRTGETNKDWRFYSCSWHQCYCSCCSRLWWWFWLHSADLINLNDNQLIPRFRGDVGFFGLTRNCIQALWFAFE